MSALLAHEPTIRLGAFLGVFLALALAEAFMPRRPRDFARWRRWPGNLGVAIVNTLLLRLIFPGSAIALAFAMQASGGGLLNQLSLPPWLAVVLAVVLLDLAIYLQHVMFHAVPALWRLHRMHHADQDLDVTSGSRFHPVEILLSMVLKLGLVAALGAPPVAVLLFEVLLNATAMFNHSNLRLPLWLDGVLRLVVVTPDMHRVHHSIVVKETNSNFGFNLPWWDRLLGTYRAQPAAGHLGMTIGLDRFRTTEDQRLDRMLLQPLRGDSGGYPIGRGDR